MLLRCLHSAWCSGGCGTGHVCCPCAVKLPLDGMQGLDEVKNMIHKLYTSLNIDQHQVGVAVWGGVGVTKSKGYGSEEYFGHGVYVCM